MIEFLERFSGSKHIQENDVKIIAEIESKGMSIQKAATNGFK